MKHDEYFLWDDDGRVVLHMDNTTQWSIQWDISLLPPQEMLPTNSTMPHNDIAYTNSEHLFGFSPCVPALLWEDAVVDEQEVMDTIDTTSFYQACKDFSVLFTVEELEAFV